MLLEIDKLCVNFGPSRVVDNVSFTVDANEKFALVGESGSGKSVTALSILLLVGVFALFGWIGLSDYVRAEFLRNRNLEFVKAARAMGLSNTQMIWRHLLPNSMTPVITFLPFRMSAAILFLAAIDFLGLGVTNVASLGDLLRQGKDNLDAWWISVPTFLLLVITLLLLTFIGDALRDAFDTRKS